MTGSRIIVCLVAVAGLVGLAPAAAARADEAPAKAPAYSLEFTNDYPGVPRHEVAAVLRSAAGELLRHFPGKAFKPIEVEYVRGPTPVIYYKQNPDGSTRVYVLKTTARGRDWCRHVYEFSHELCHMLHNADAGGFHHAVWFGESLSELASLYTLRALAERWKTEPPFVNYADYAPHFGAYAGRYVDGARLAEGVTFPTWFEEHKAEMMKAGVNRKLNRVVAVRLLPLFEAEPSRWEAVQWLFLRRAGAAAGPGDFGRVLAEWKWHCPQRHKPFVDEVAAVFGVKLEAANGD